MKKVSFVVDRFYRNNVIFDKEQTSVKVRDNVFDRYYALSDEFALQGYEIATCDINSINESDYVIYADLPKKLPSAPEKTKSFLLLLESPLIKPENYKLENHRNFNKIFTWHDELVDGDKYVKINCAFDLPATIKKNIGKTKFLCLIVSNKNSNRSGELYSERKRLIRWYEQNHSDEFDLYGMGWNEFRFEGPRAVRVFNRSKILRRMMYKAAGERFPSYRGRVDNKVEIMSQYKFAVCFENIRDIPGYITEKILDAFFAGCVPIYLGANNVGDHIPSGCFIDMRQYATLTNLYEYLTSMSDDVYLDYLNNIELFLNSEQGYQFSSKRFAEVVVSNVINSKSL